MSTPSTVQHGVKGVYYGGDWLDIEDCAGKFDSLGDKSCKTSGCDYQDKCPRSRSRNVKLDKDKVYDICIVGAGCIGAAIARELSKYKLSILWVEAADDVSQGATKGNSGIVHAGYDDKPGSVRAQHCWSGNQMFAELDRDLRFGYQKNGSLVLAFNKFEMKELNALKERGEKNGVQNLRIVQKDELRELEPNVNPDAIAALYSPDAGNVIPYEFAIALAENAVDNGVELMIRTQVAGINILQDNDTDGAANFTVHLEHWEPSEYIEILQKESKNSGTKLSMLIAAGIIFGHYLSVEARVLPYVDSKYHLGVLIAMYLYSKFYYKTNRHVSKSTPLTTLVDNAEKPIGEDGNKVSVADMLTGGSGSGMVHDGKVVDKLSIKTKYIINCAGGNSDKIAYMIDDNSFKIKPRLGDYLLLNRNQGHLAKHTLFPCPDPVLGKGVLVQTTLWGNLILGPTARDVNKPEARDMSDASVQEYILSKCKKLVPSFDPKETIHAFCGARAKSDRGDWIIGPSKKNPRMIHVAGIDSPGLAGAPSISLKVCSLLEKAGLDMQKDPNFIKDRAPIIFPKDGMKGLKMGPVGKYDSDGSNMEQMAHNVICKCEKVTELEVVRALRRSLPIDSSQAIRKRTRAGMGHCQGDPENYNCEARVRAIIARENGIPISLVEGRPWPATSTLPKRWIDDKDKEVLEKRML